MRTGYTKSGQHTYRKITLLLPTKRSRGILPKNAFMALFYLFQVIFKVKSNFQGQKPNGRQIFQGQIIFFNK